MTFSTLKENDQSSDKKIVKYSYTRRQFKSISDMSVTAP